MSHTRLIPSSSDNNDLKVYASKFRDGEIGIVVVNETASDLSFNIDWSLITDADKYNSVHWYEFYANSITPGDKRFYINAGHTHASKELKWYRMCLLLIVDL